MTDTPDWKPSREIKDKLLSTFWKTFDQFDSYNNAVEAALIAVRPLMRDEILAEEQPKIEAMARAEVYDLAQTAIASLLEDRKQIEAAERERIARHFDDPGNEFIGLATDHRAAGIEKMKQAITTELGHIFEFDGDPFEFVNDIATAALAAWEAHNANEGYTFSGDCIVKPGKTVLCSTKNPGD